MFFSKVFQCKKQYCDKKCDFGNKRDEYGCETCECIDPCEHVKCGKMETCVKGICGKSKLIYVITDEYKKISSTNCWFSLQMRKEVLQWEVRVRVQAGRLRLWDVRLRRSVSRCWVWRQQDLRQRRLWYVHITNGLESWPLQGQTYIFLQYTSASINTVPSNVRSVTCWTCTAVRRVSASTRARMCTVARTRSASTAFAVILSWQKFNFLFFMKSTFTHIVFECEKKYCQEKCDYGFKVDQYGCQNVWLHRPMQGS